MPVRTKSVRLIGTLAAALACCLVAPVGASAGTLALRFVDQPAATAKGQALKGTPGASPSVEIFDSASGNRRTSYRGRVTMTLDATLGYAGAFTQSSTTNVAFVSGLATFSNLRVDRSGTFRLHATSPDVTPASSAAFEVADQVQDCTPASCKTNGALQGKNTTFNINGTLTQGGGSLLASGFLNGIGATTTLTCDGFLPDYVNPSEDTYQFAYSPGAIAASSIVTMVVNKATMNAVTNNGGPFLEMCFGAPYGFPVKPGSGPPLGQTDDYDYDGNGPKPLGDGKRGLLPNCGDDLTLEIACVLSREKTGGGIGIVKAFVAANDADPRMH